ncbi:hypothetical protein ACTWPB_11930 [Nocardia sp. IBHARD005]|uniref:hypothetical protein n=1 Tax=Nocardia sp. IBHARD005 TaxID=3457765 RepID=UPI00405893C0
MLSDDHGARLLSRLLWGLSYQARPGTVLVIDREFLMPTPFDADPADPIVLVPQWCTRLDERGAAQLKAQLPLRHSEGTVRWQTSGLERTLEPQAFDAWCAERRYRSGSSHVARRRGLLVLTARTPDHCRQWALDAARLDSARYGTDHVYLDAWDRGHDGEIQIFRKFRPMVGVAEQARAQVLSRADAPSAPSELRAAVWDEAESVRVTRTCAFGSGPGMRMHSVLPPARCSPTLMCTRSTISPNSAPYGHTGGCARPG